MPTTVRDAVFDVLRNHGVDRIFANPGSTEVDLLTDLPADLEFVLALHEDRCSASPPVTPSRPTGPRSRCCTPPPATATPSAAWPPRRPTAPGGAARRSAGPAGTWRPRRSWPATSTASPVTTRSAWTQPSRPGDVPGAVARALHAATVRRGPAVIIIPMSDWSSPPTRSAHLARRLVVGTAAGPDAVAVLATALRDAERPAWSSARSPTANTWAAVAELAAALDAPVWQAAYSYRMGFDQTSPLFAGRLPPARAGCARALGAHGVVLVLGGHAFRQTSTTRATWSPRAPGPGRHRRRRRGVRQRRAGRHRPGGRGRRQPGRDLPRRRAARAAPRASSAHRRARCRDRPRARVPGARRGPARGSTYFEESPSTPRRLLARLPVRRRSASSPPGWAASASPYPARSA